MLLKVWVLLAAAVLAIFAGTTEAVTDVEQAALIDFYNALGGPYWASPWNISNNSPCGWIGVTCFPNGTLATLLFPTNRNLSGSLPDSIFTNLTNLTSFEISNNPAVTGTIPSSVGLLTKLFYLAFTYNSMMAPIPDVFGGLSKLVTLKLIGNNQFNGGLLPASIGSATALTTLLVQQTGITGSIPTSYAALTSLSTLSLDTNPNLGGVLPEIFGGMTKLQTFTFYSTQISGTLPLSLGNCTLLAGLQIYGTQLSGPLTDIFGRMTAFTSLTLQRNPYITGPLPAGLNQMALKTLYIADMPLLETKIPDKLLKTLTSLTLTDAPKLTFNATAVCSLTGMAVNACTMWNTGTCLPVGTTCSACNIPTCGSTTALATLGCYIDTATPRVLTFYAWGYGDNPSNTPALCQQSCSHRSVFYKYAGVEGAGQCWCGNSYGLLTPSNSCNVPCTGNNNLTCGASGSIYMWAYLPMNMTISPYFAPVPTVSSSLPSAAATDLPNNAAQANGSLVTITAGAGAGGAVLLAAAGVAYFYLRRRRQVKRKETMPSELLNPSTIYADYFSATDMMRFNEHSNPLQTGYGSPTHLSASMQSLMFSGSASPETTASIKTAYYAGS